jgi:TRAP-type mannitol/chloroaromatic compound transport system permease large subunit
MTQLAISTAYERRAAVDAASLAAHTSARRSAFEQRLQSYIATQGWTLGTLLASILLVVMTTMSGGRSVVDVLTGAGTALRR